MHSFYSSSYHCVFEFGYFLKSYFKENKKMIDFGNPHSYCATCFQMCQLWICWGRISASGEAATCMTFSFFLSFFACKPQAHLRCRNLCYVYASSLLCFDKAVFLLIQGHYLSSATYLLRLVSHGLGVQIKGNILIMFAAAFTFWILQIDNYL